MNLTTEMWHPVSWNSTSPIDIEYYTHEYSSAKQLAIIVNSFFVTSLELIESMKHIRGRDYTYEIYDDAAGKGMESN